MKRLPLGAVLCACALAFSLAGCSSSPAEPAKSVDADSIKGFWVLDSSTQLGFDAVLNLDEEDNLAELMIADALIEGNWATDGTNATVTFDADSAQSKTASVFVSDGKLTLGDASGSRLIFTKGDMDAYFAAQGEVSGASSSASGSEDAVELDSDNAEVEDVEVVDEVINDIDPVSIVDDGTVQIKATGKGTDFTGDPGYRLTITNNTKKAIYVTGDDTFKVGDKDVEAGLGEVVEAGETVETFIYFSAEDLGGSVDALKNVSGKLIVGDDESGDEIATYDFQMD